MMITKRAKFLVHNLDLPAATGIEWAAWEHFQLDHLNDDNPLRCEGKARQIAISFTFAAEAIANAILDGISSLFQSINLDEAREKIIYARTIYECLYVRGMPKITQPNTTTSIGFSNGARIISSPGTPQRGKSRFWVYLDEWAHQKHDRANYVAAFPIVSKGGKLRGASSPMGASGIFWEVLTEELRPYSGYTRKITPWWVVKSFLANNDLIKDAYYNAPDMTTQNRVDKYGNKRIKMIFENMPDDSFAQEYEVLFTDSTSSWISWELITRNQKDDLLYYHITNHNDIDRLIQDVKQAIIDGLIEPSFVGGLDIGRIKDLTEFVGCGKSSTGQLPIRLMISLADTPYEHQEHCIYRILTELPFVACLIDRNGIGSQMAETLEQSTVAEGVNFTNATKELWAVETLLQFQRNNVPIPNYRDLAYQIHSIKKTVTAARNNVFDTERNAKHHADKFWALALSLWAARAAPIAPSSETIDVDIDIYKPERERNRLWR